MSADEIKLIAHGKITTEIRCIKCNNEFENVEELGKHLCFRDYEPHSKESLDEMLKDLGLTPDVFN